MRTAPIALLIARWLDLGAALDELSAGPLTPEAMADARALSADFWMAEADLVAALAEHGLPVVVGGRSYQHSLDRTRVVVLDVATGLAIAGRRTVLSTSYVPTPRARIYADFSEN